MTQAVGLIRLSPTASDSDELEQRLDQQRQAIEDHAAEAGKVVEEIFVEKRVSGRKTPPQQREAVEEMVEYLREHPDVEEIIVQHKDRLTRQPGPQVGISHIIEGMVGRVIDIYDVIEDEYIGRFENIDDYEKGGQLLMSVVQGMSSDIEKEKENAKIERRLKNKKKEWKPTGKPPRAINSNRAVFDDSESLYYCPLPDQYVKLKQSDQETPEFPEITPDSEFTRFERIIEVLNEYWSKETDESEYSLGKRFGYTSNPGNTVKSMINSHWKYWQAYHVMQAMDVYPDPLVTPTFREHVADSVTEHVPESP